MNFDFGEVLTRAGQITWKHKVLWLINLLPLLLALLIAPFVFILMFLGFRNPREFENFLSNPVVIFLFFAFQFLFILGSWVLRAISQSSATLGIWRAEAGDTSTSFMELLRDGLQYFWRILGVMLLIGLAIGLLFFIFVGCIMAFTLVTMGMGSVCVQPFMLLLMPLSLLAMAVMEQAEAAVIVDNKSVIDAVKLSLNLVKTHLWKYVLVTLVVYFGMSIVTSILIFPLMIPFFGLSFISFSSDEPFRYFFWIMGLGMLIFVPIIVFVQSILLTFMKSSLVVLYLRITQKPNSPIESEDNDKTLLAAGPNA
jgi:hypothetical protein